MQLVKKKAKLSVSSWHTDGKLVIDGAEVGLHVRRMGMDEFIEYERQYFDYANGERPRGATAEVDTTGMSPEEAFMALQKAEAEVELYKTPAQKEEDRQRLIDRSAQLLAWLKVHITQSAKFAEGDVEIDGAPVVTGEQILKVFGARQILMMQIANVIWAQNRLPEGVLKNLPSPSDFQVGSGERETEADGPTPEPTAASADSSDSAETGAATQAPSDEQR